MGNLLGGGPLPLGCKSRTSPTHRQCGGVWPASVLFGTARPQARETGLSTLPAPCPALTIGRPVITGFCDGTVFGLPEWRSSVKTSRDARSDTVSRSDRTESVLLTNVENDRRRDKRSIRFRWSLRHDPSGSSAGRSEVDPRVPFPAAVLGKQGHAPQPVWPWRG